MPRGSFEAEKEKLQRDKENAASEIAGGVIIIVLLERYCPNYLFRLPMSDFAAHFTIKLLSLGVKTPLFIKGQVTSLATHLT